MNKPQRQNTPVLLQDLLEDMNTPDSILFKDYNAAIVMKRLIESIHREMETALILNALQKSKEETAQEAFEAYIHKSKEEERFAKLIEQQKAIYAQLNNPNNQVSLLYHLDATVNAWIATETQRDQVLAHREQTIATWKAAQVALADEVINLFNHLNLPLNDGGVVEFNLDAEAAAEIRERIENGVLPLQALEKNPVKKEIFVAEKAKQLAAQLEETGKTPEEATVEDHAVAAQKASAAMNMPNQALLNRLLIMIPRLKEAIRKQITPEVLEKVIWSSPKNNIVKSLEEMIINTDSFKAFKQMVTDLDKDFIKDTAELESLNQLLDAQRNKTNELLALFKTTLERDPKTANKLKKIFAADETQTVKNKDEVSLLETPMLPKNPSPNN